MSSGKALSASGGSSSSNSLNLAGFSRNTMSFPRRNTSTRLLRSLNCFGNRTAWLFPDWNTRAMTGE